MKLLSASVASLTRPANGRINRGLIFLLALALGAGGALGLPALRSHASIANTALILDTTVTPDPSLGGKSLEQSRAEAHGFTVTVITGAQWAAMSAADFAKYQLIILGDPTCDPSVGGATHAPAVANESWEGAVLSSGGNVAIIGTDPVFHNKFGGGGASPPGSGGAFKLVDNGIAFSGAIAGATGAYVDLSCIYTGGASSTPVPLLDGLSSHGSHQFTVTSAPCLGSIAIVAATGPTAGLHDADLSNWGCSVHEYFNMWPSDYTVLALATDPTVAKTYSARDVDTHAIVSGSPYILVRGTGVTISSNISLSPASATNPAGPTSSHTVTATVTRATTPPTPVVATNVTFRVESGPNTGQTFTGPTDTNGQVSWTYFDIGGTGTDTISATFVDDLGATEKATATKTWVSAEQNITASPNSFSATEGQPFAGQTVATFCDPNLTDTADYTATVAWGDSSSSPPPPVTVTPSGVSACGRTFDVKGDHSYTEEGTYVLTVTITDTDTISNTATVHPTATVGDAALRAACAAAPFSTQSFSGPTATFVDQDPNGVNTDYTATISWGDSSSSTGTVTGGPGNGPYTVSGTHNYSSTGVFTITTTIKDHPASAIATCPDVVVAAFPTANGGTFVVGDLEATGPLASLTWWSSQWAKINLMSGGPAPSSMKGFAGFEDMALPVPLPPLNELCGKHWTTDPGNSTPPPPSVPPYMLVIVSSHITQTGSVIEGDIHQLIIVKNDPGYAPDPGHPGTGNEVILVCTAP
jgi:hypothetical protein